MYYVYTLVDPCDQRAYYVGTTKNPGRRFTEHLRCRDGNTAKATWIQRLQRFGWEPLFRIIDQTDHPELAKQFEDYWITVYRQAHHPLTNQMTLDLYRRRVARGAIMEGQYEL